MLRVKVKSFGIAACLILGACAGSACRQDMHDNPRYEPYEDGANRQLPEGTVARGSLDTNPPAPKSGSGQAQTPKAQTSPPPAQTTTAPAAGQPASSPTGQAAAAGGSAAKAVPAGEDGFPFKVTREILDRGESRFNISCSPCHGRLGDGNGMIVQRGFRRPPSYLEERLRKAPSSYFYDVMTNGFGAMPSYADQLTPEDRWKVIAYLRVLQLSQSANVSELAEVDKKGLEKAEQGTKEQSGSHSSQNPTAKPAGGHNK